MLYNHLIIVFKCSDLTNPIYKKNAYLKRNDNNDREPEDENILNFPCSTRFQSLQQVQHKHKVLNLVREMTNNILVATYLYKQELKLMYNYFFVCPLRSRFRL